MAPLGFVCDHVEILYDLDIEAKQIADNVAGFFSILAEWSRAEPPVSANDNTGAATPDDAEGRHDR